MTRTSAILRDATESDVPRLAVLWSDLLRRGTGVDPETEMAAVVAGVSTHPRQRIVVAEYDGALAGAVYVQAGPMTPLNLEPIVLALSPAVFPEYRGRGVGRALMEAVAAYAEERGIAHVASASLSGSRDASRFLARLGLSPQAVLRFGSTQTLRSRLTAQAPTRSRTGRQLGKVLAARRSQRQRAGVVADSAHDLPASG